MLMSCSHASIAHHLVYITNSRHTLTVLHLTLTPSSCAFSSSTLTLRPSMTDFIKPGLVMGALGVIRYLDTEDPTTIFWARGQPL